MQSPLNYTVISGNGGNGIIVRRTSREGNFVKTNGFFGSITGNHVEFFTHVGGNGVDVIRTEHISVHIVVNKRDIGHRSTSVNDFGDICRLYYYFGRLDNGLVSFPLALLVMSLLYSYGRISGETAISSLFILGFGDGAAAVTGYLLHKRGKSIEGSLSMFLVSVLVLLLFSGLSLPYCLIVAFAAAAAERLTPSGLDNLTVPITAALFMEIICLLR